MLNVLNNFREEICRWTVVLYVSTMSLSKRNTILFTMLCGISMLIPVRLKFFNVKIYVAHNDDCTSKGLWLPVMCLTVWQQNNGPRQDLRSVAAHVGDIRNTYRIIVEVSERRRPPRHRQVRAAAIGLREIRLEVSNLTGISVVGVYFS